VGLAQDEESKSHTVNPLICNTGSACSIIIQICFFHYLRIGKGDNPLLSELHLENIFLEAYYGFFDKRFKIARFTILPKIQDGNEQNLQKVRCLVSPSEARR
jgi:hypothetical protein